MSNELSYKKDQIKQIIESASRFFDVVRLVDPINMIVYTVDGGKLQATEESCYHVWNKQDRCENCISARCFADNHRYSKFEFIDHDVYHVVAQCVTVDDHRYVLEAVTESNDDVLLSAFGDNDFVDRITSFNHQVYTDDLTGLSNRRYLNDRLSIMTNRAAGEGASLSVVMMDIDDFKRVNDTFGHVVGDKALRFAAQALEGVFVADREDIVVRYGGDEFIAASQGKTAEELDKCLESLRSTIASNEVEFTVSIGAFYQEHAEHETVEELIRQADEAMYRAKASGKNQYLIKAR